MKNKIFLNNIIERLKDLENLKCIILYGSYARGDYNKESDIDLLIVLGVEEPKNYLSEVIKRISDIDKEGKVSPRLTNMNDYDKSFFQNVLREGKVLFGSLILNSDSLALKPYLLINYNLNTLDNVTKVKVSRSIYGYTSKKKLGNKVKIYTYKGLKDRDGIFVHKGSILLPEEEKEFLDFLKRENVLFKEKRVWLE